MYNYTSCGYSLVVESHASDLVARVRFSLPAPKCVFVELLIIIDISEFEDILPIIEELQDGLTYEEIECVGVNDCCNETNKNYVVEIQGFIDSNDEFITKEELMALENVDEGMLDTFIITIHMCVNCGKWVLGILEDEI